MSCKQIKALKRELVNWQISEDAFRTKHGDKGLELTGQRKRGREIGKNSNSWLGSVQTNGGMAARRVYAEEMRLKRNATSTNKSKSRNQKSLVTECPLYVRHCLEILYIISFNPHTIPVRYMIFAALDTDEETEASRHEVAKSHIVFPRK